MNLDSQTLPPATKPATDRKWAHLALAAIVLAMLARPRDIAWVFDQGLLIGHALMYNALPSHTYGLDLRFTPAITGLLGTRGLYYGPLPTWIYQIFLGITHNISAIVQMRTFLVAGTTAISLAWLARIMRCSPWLAVITMLSPWMWLYSRQIWDNTFCIPLTALTFAAYGNFLATHRRGSLLLTIGGCLACLLVHLFTLALVLPILAHISLTQLRWVWRYKWGVVAIIAVFAFLAWPYLSFLRQHNQSGVEVIASPVNGWFFPLLGAHHLSAAGLGNDLEGDWLVSLGNAWLIIGTTAQTITLIAYPLVWFGILLAGVKCWPAARLSPKATAIHHLSLVAILSYITQTALDGIERIYEFPHYFNGNWIIFVFFAWLAADQIGKWLWDRTIIVRALPAIYAGCLLTALSAVAWKIIRDGGTRGIGFGTTLANQIDAVRKISEYSPQSPDVELYFPQWQMFDHAMPELYGLVNPPPGHIPTGRILVRYAGQYPDARIMVETLPAATTAP